MLNSQPYDYTTHNFQSLLKSYTHHSHALYVNKCLSSTRPINYELYSRISSIGVCLFTHLVVLNAEFASDTTIQHFSKQKKIWSTKFDFFNFWIFLLFRFFDFSTFSMFSTFSIFPIFDFFYFFNRHTDWSNIPQIEFLENKGCS